MRLLVAIVWATGTFVCAQADAANISLDGARNIIAIVGEIGPADADLLDSDMYRVDPMRPVTVALNSDAGDLGAAYDVVRVILRYQHARYWINTFVGADDKCWGPCISIFTVGDEKLVERIRAEIDLPGDLYIAGNLHVLPVYSGKYFPIDTDWSKARTSDNARWLYQTGAPVSVATSAIWNGYVDGRDLREWCVRILPNGPPGAALSRAVGQPFGSETSAPPLPPNACDPENLHPPKLYPIEDPPRWIPEP